MFSVAGPVETVNRPLDRQVACHAGYRSYLTKNYIDRLPSGRLGGYGFFRTVGAR